MINVSHLKKNYGKKIVLDDISFQAKCGEYVVIAGKNGCGKTILMKILAGIIKPDGGEILYFGKNPIAARKNFHKYCGYVPQELPLMEELSVKDNLRLWQADKSPEYKNIVRLFQLEEIMKVRVSKLSGGMKRRLSIACALAEWPPILLMDEPTTALDIFYKESILNLLREYQKLNGIVITTTHDENEILNSDRCLVMNEGKLTEFSNGKVSIDNIKKYIFG